MRLSYIVRQIECDWLDTAATQCDRSVRSRHIGYAELRRQLRADGWLCDATGDWCPDHRPAPPEATEVTG